jgi:hypothetical protein
LNWSNFGCQTLITLLDRLQQYSPSGLFLRPFSQTLHRTVAISSGIALKRKNSQQWMVGADSGSTEVPGFVTTFILVTIATLLAFAQTGIRELAVFLHALFLLFRACLFERRVVGILSRGVARKRLLRRAFKAALWSVPSYLRGDYRQAARRLNPLIRHLETQLAVLSEKQKNELATAQDTIELMAAVFNHQMRCHLLGGCLDDAMQTLLRARTALGVERLGAFPEIDFKNAQLVKAGLAAGKLIDGSGLSALLINPPTGGVDIRGLEGASRKRHSRPLRISDVARQPRGGRKAGKDGDKAGSGGDGDSKMGVVIPFRLESKSDSPLI